MDILFKGEGEDAEGNPIVLEFSTWRELAEAEPWFLITPDTLRPDEIEFLIGEFRKIIPVESRDDKPVKVQAQPNPYQVSDPHIRFAIINLARLTQDGGDLTAAYEAYASEQIKDILGNFTGLEKTLIKKQGKKWKAVKLRPVDENNLKVDRSVECDRLMDAYHLGLLDFTDLWHAIRILLNAPIARKAVRDENAELALEAGLIVGESSRALGVKVAASGSGNDAVEAKRVKNQPCNDWLHAELTKDFQNSDKPNTEIAGHLLKRLDDHIKKHSPDPKWEPPEHRTLRKKIGEWKKAGI